MIPQRRCAKVAIIHFGKRVIDLRLPDFRARLRQDGKYLLWLPVYLLIFLLLEQRSLDTYWATQIPLDDLIPFCEWFAIPYYLWYPLLVGVGVVLFFRDSLAFRRYMVFLAATFFISVAIWFLIPNGQDLRPPALPRNNLLTRLMAGIYAIDTHTNVFPSVHVVGSVGAALAAWDCAAIRDRKWLVWGITVLAALICLSVVFVKQHGILDLLGGLVLSAVVGVLFYHKKQ